VLRLENHYLRWKTALMSSLKTYFKNKNNFFSCWNLLSKMRKMFTETVSYFSKWSFCGKMAWGKIKFGTTITGLWKNSFSTLNFGKIGTWNKRLCTHNDNVLWKYISYYFILHWFKDWRCFAFSANCFWENFLLSAHEGLKCFFVIEIFLPIMNVVCDNHHMIYYLALYSSSKLPCCFFLSKHFIKFYMKGFCLAWYLGYFMNGKLPQFC